MGKTLIYVIRSIEHNYTYVGITNNLERRLSEHANKYSKATKPYAPFRLLLTEKYPDKKSARIRERFLKSGKGREFLTRYK